MVSFNKKMMPSVETKKCPQWWLLGKFKKVLSVVSCGGQGGGCTGGVTQCFGYLVG